MVVVKWDAGKSYVSVSSEMTRLTRHEGVSRDNRMRGEILLALYPDKDVPDRASAEEARDAAGFSELEWTSLIVRPALYTGNTPALASPSNVTSRTLRRTRCRSR
jgi:hypothetical protein